MQIFMNFTTLPFCEKCCFEWINFIVLTIMQFHIEELRSKLVYSVIVSFCFMKPYLYLFVISFLTLIPNGSLL